MNEYINKQTSKLQVLHEKSQTVHATVHHMYYAADNICIMHSTRVCFGVCARRLNFKVCMCQPPLFVNAIK